VADDETFFKRLEKEFDFFSSTLCFLAGEALADASSWRFAIGASAFVSWKMYYEVWMKIIWGRQINESSTLATFPKPTCSFRALTEAFQASLIPLTRSRIADSLGVPLQIECLPSLPIAGPNLEAFTTDVVTGRSLTFDKRWSSKSTLPEEFQKAKEIQHKYEMFRYSAGTRTRDAVERGSTHQLYRWGFDHTMFLHGQDTHTLRLFSTWHFLRMSILL